MKPEKPDQHLAQMLVALINERDVQFSRVSRILHDEAGQVLSAVGLHLDVLKLDFRDQAPGVVESAAQIQALLEQVISQLRELSYELNPSIVERAGLQVAMDRLAGRQRQNFAGSIRLFFDAAVHVRAPLASTLFKIAEFALDNAVQHSKATQIELIVKRSHNEIVLEVRDNGVGFVYPDTHSEPHGLGLKLIEYYAYHNEINLVLRTNPGRGTIVRASLPAETS